MGGIEAALAVLAALVGAAAVVRGLGRLAVASLRAAAGSAGAAREAGQRLGLRGLLATLAGTATLVGPVASATAASASASAIAVPTGAPNGTAPWAPPARAAAPAPHVHQVRRGESFWSITALLLGPDATATDVANAWPHLYDANRAAVGRDPSYLRVGTRLTVPHQLDRTTSRRTGTSASSHPAPAPSGSARTALSLDPDRR